MSWWGWVSFRSIEWVRREQRLGRGSWHLLLGPVSAQLYLLRHRRLLFHPAVISFA